VEDDSGAATLVELTSVGVGSPVKNPALTAT